MIPLARFLTLSLCAFALVSISTAARSESAMDAIARATAAIEAAAPYAQADPARPLFHITAPAQWINDPNGPIYYRGNYHLFYQLHPFSDGNGPKYWGHVRSRDLAKWETLPIALAPSPDAGEAEVWSGCCTINGQGKAMIFYTSIAPGKSAQTHSEQWAAIGDEDLITWRKSPDNPVLSEALHEGRKIYEWRDPFIFRDRNRTFMVLGGNLNETKGGQAVVNIYEAQASDLTQWKYRGVLFQLPDPQARTAECPNFFKLGNRWVLFVSPYGKVQYFIGDFDRDTCRFHAQRRGLLDLGPNFYAPNTMQVPDGRRLVWGWINGFPGGRGWNGCLSLPRLLTLSSNGQLHQSPAPQLAKLRGKSVEWQNMRVDPAGWSCRLPNTDSLEILADIDLESSDALLLSFKARSTTDSGRVTIKINRSQWKSEADSNSRSKSRKGDLSLAVDMKESERRLTLRIFIDRSVLEVFANDCLCATKVIPLVEANPTLNIQTESGTARAKRIQCWPINSIW